jgi:hypothetical protein
LAGQRLTNLAIKARLEHEKELETKFQDSLQGMTPGQKKAALAKEIKKQQDILAIQEGEGEGGSGTAKRAKDRIEHLTNELKSAEIHGQKASIGLTEQERHGGSLGASISLLDVNKTMAKHLASIDRKIGGRGGGMGGMGKYFPGVRP